MVPSALNTVAEANLCALRQLLAEIAAGRVLDAFRRWYGPDVRMQENEQEPTVGFAANLVREEAFVASVAQWHSFEVLAAGAGGDHTFAETVGEWTTTDGQRVRARQVSVARWRDGRIIEERFVYEGQAA